MLDFTIEKYRELVGALQQSGISFRLRHDVDKKPLSSLRIAQVEHEMGVKAIYYFRAKKGEFEADIIKQISELGHEIGYHYESLTTCNGNMELAYQDFCKNLEQLRKIVPVKSICMHGSPRSPYDSLDLWKQYDYHALGIESESYLDTDFSTTFYLTDTGRRWDGYKVSVRDKIPQYQSQWEREGLVFHSTNDVVKALQKGIIKYPNLLITTHPQRWTSFGCVWVKEWLLQLIKNPIKKILIARNNK